MSMLQNLMGEFMGGGSMNNQQQHGLVQSVAGLLSDPRIGGVSGLAKMFESQGLGHIAQGWISNGPNPPVSASQLQQVLGSSRIAEIAGKLGIDPNQAANQLSAILPHAVDHLTPNGATPAGQGMNAQGILQSLESKFFGA
jgi:uncharacterized protein YidB (DUF937 family)